MNKLVFALFSACILLSSCHALVEDEFPDFAKMPVLNAFLQADSIIQVQVCFTANLNDSTPAYASNAQVIIEGSNADSDTLQYTKKGWFISKLKAQVGVTYTCKVNIGGYKQVLAKTTIPDNSIIFDIEFTKVAALGNQGSIISSYEFTLPNYKTKTCYWHVRFVKPGYDYSYDSKTKEVVEYPTWTEKSIYMIPGKDSVLLTEPEPLTIFSNKKMDNDIYRVKFFIDSYSSVFQSYSDSYIEVRSVDESYYKYQKQLFLYYTATYHELGSSPQAYPLFTNVTNGLGIFTSFSTYRKSVKD